MKKPGYYYKRVEKGNSNVAWTKAVLRKDGKDIVSVTASDTRKGLQVSPDNKQLLLDGVKIAEASDPSLVDFSADKFGDIPINTGAKVINITLADYNRLRSGDVPKGYRRYDPKAVYDIVEDVATAGELYVDDLDENVAEDRILANMLGTLPDNELKTAQDKLDYGCNTYTFISPTNGTPHLSVYNPTAVIEPGGVIEFDYMVDTRNMAGLNLCQFGQTFTVIVEDMFGRELFRRTTYAGIFHCRIEGVKDEDGDDNFVGEGWWSIRAIDGNHVDSVTHYFDFLSKETEAENFLEPTAEDLLAWGIKAYDASDSTTASAEQGWRNKYGLSKLMFKAKADGHNGLRLPVGTYYIDYHKNVAAGFKWSNAFNLGTPVDLGQHKYYLIHISSTTDEDGFTVKNLDRQEIVAGGSVVIGATTFSLEQNETPLDFLCRDGAKLYRDGNDKVRVPWAGDNLGANEVNCTDSDLCLCTQPFGRLDALKEVEDENGNKKKVKTWTTKEDGWYYMTDGTVPYVAQQGYVGGDFLKLPDGFTLDLNGSTLKGVQCVDIRVNAWLVHLENNTDTHVIKGTIDGIYLGYDFKRSYIQCGVAAKGPHAAGEGIKNIGYLGCRWCSFEEITSAHSLGYDGVDEFGGSVGSSTFNVKGLGYRDQYTGELVDIGGPLAPVPSTSTDKGKFIDLVYYGTPEANVSVTYDTLIVYCQKGCHYGCGKQHELFVHWFREDDDGRAVYVKTVKTHLYHIVKKPLSCYGTRLVNGKNRPRARFLITGYGLSKMDGNGNRELASPTSWELGKMASYSKRGCCNLFKDCTFENTRSCALTGAQSKGSSYIHCTFYNIAMEPDDPWGVTRYLGDLEEGWQFRDTITIKDCVAIKVGGSRSTLQINTARNFLFCNNEGFVIKDCGGIESAWIHDNKLRELRITRNYFYEHPAICYRNNTVARVGGITDDTRPFTFKGSLTDVYNKTNDRANRCDDPISNTVAFTDCVIPLVANNNNTTNEQKFDMRLYRSKVGDNYKD